MNHMYVNSYDFFIYEFICFMNSSINSGVLRFQMWDEGQIMKVIYLKKKPNNSRFYTFVLFKKPPGTAVLGMRVDIVSAMSSILAIF